MQQIVANWSTTLNLSTALKKTQLYQAAEDLQVEAVRFLLLQENIQVNQLSGPFNFQGYEGEEDEQRTFQSPLHLAVRKLYCHNYISAEANGHDHPWHLNHKEIEKCNEIRTMLVGAGGVQVGW